MSRVLAEPGLTKIGADSNPAPTMTSAQASVLSKPKRVLMLGASGTISRATARPLAWAWS